MLAKPLASLALAAATLLLASPGAAELKRVAYPQVKIETAKPYQPDAAFTQMRQALREAAARRDSRALFALVAPGFVWTGRNGLADGYDPGRDPLQNFQVVFGFRLPGKGAEGGVQNGPYWDLLRAFASDTSYYQASDSGDLVCGPMMASPVDPAAFEAARRKIESGDEASEWVFAAAAIPVARSPGDTGPPVARLTQEAVPVLSAFPPGREGQPAAVPPTHYEVLLPSGRTGWIAASAARPLLTDRLCYVRTSGGAWKIAIFDASE